MRLARSRVHFIGVGGIGMCGLAELLHNLGAKVSGSDSAENAQTIRLKKMGLEIFIGHSEKQIQDLSQSLRPANQRNLCSAHCSGSKKDHR